MGPRVGTAAIVDAFRKLDPRVMVTNPVMFVVEVGATLTTILLVRDLFTGGDRIGFELQITSWLWLTVLSPTSQRRWRKGGESSGGHVEEDQDRDGRASPRERPTDDVPAASLRKGDIVVVRAGEFIPSDGEIIEGVASVDESAITGESAPVIRESGGDRSAVTGGTRVLSDWIHVSVTADPGHTFLDRMIALVEGAERQKTPNEIALNILLAGLTIVFLMAVVTLQPFAVLFGCAAIHVSSWFRCWCASFPRLSADCFRRLV